ncbi:MAG: hypothetical protein KAT68_18545 [Bacteroidales bacterium]|nr:hypothetical protein [Bacteroidales bacterium]
MKFTQYEIVELKKISSLEGVPMIFNEDVNNSIDFDFANNKSIQSIIKKGHDGYMINARNSNGTDFYYQSDKFDHFKNQVCNWVKAIKRDNPYEFEQKENIKNICEKFYLVFQEATIIDELGFKESSGMIFRKALEFIVKDFLKILIPDFQNTINEKTIGQIIFYFYDVENDHLVIKGKPEFSSVHEELNTIKVLAKKIRNTFKIGNDFSHYERKLIEFTTEDLKLSILQIVTFIDNLVEERKLQIKRSEQDDEFKIDKLI